MTDEYTHPLPEHVTVMGLGRFGGGAGVTRWLAGRGCRVLLTDLGSEHALADSLAGIDDLVRSGAVTLRLGEHRSADFTDTDLVVANPAVPMPWANTYLRAAYDAGVPVTTEIELLIDALPDRRRVIGVTGSAGKSTTASLIVHMLNHTMPAPMRAFLGGNIGGSLLHRTNDITTDDWVVLELSSAMLYWLSCRRWSPHIAVLTNIAPNHIDWHGSFEHYVRSKHAIAAFQSEGDLLVYPDVLLTEGLGPPLQCPAKVIPTEGVDLPRHVQLPGRHNVINAAFAGLAADAAFERSTGRPMTGDEYVSSQRSFPGLPHRLEVLGDRPVPDDPGATFRAINDSKCTTPEAAERAVEAVLERWPETRIHLICGGYDKQVDLGPLIEAARRCVTVATIGATGPVIGAGLADASSVHLIDAGTLDAAVRGVLACVRGGDTVLLSPGCASWDQFVHFEARGEAFGEGVGGW